MDPLTLEPGQALLGRAKLSCGDGLWGLRAWPGVSKSREPRPGAAALWLCCQLIQRDVMHFEEWVLGIFFLSVTLISSSFLGLLLLLKCSLEFGAGRGLEMTGWISWNWMG
ncbi:hypothetical protein EDD15DRAFT_2201913 [Pisolithus albus]|nr:hypothetical protein EDD15DRAFT_2201913 [Pisolithus albus]